MDQSEVLRRLIDAGLVFTELTQRRAEAVVRDMVQAGEARSEQAQHLVDDLIERSRENSERVRDAVRAEMSSRLGRLDVATTADIARLERRIDDLAAALAAAKRAPAGKKAAAKRAPAGKKSAAAARPPRRSQGSGGR